jgi:hypothetical protein
MIVCEVEFIQLYHGQPLFADVDAWMRAHGMRLHKFLGMGGRVMKPLSFNGSTVYPSQCMWSDAVYTRDLFALDRFSGEQLLKFALLAERYDSQDLALYVLRCYDARENDDLGQLYLEQLARAGQWQVAGASAATTKAAKP